MSHKRKCESSDDGPIQKRARTEDDDAENKHDNGEDGEKDYDKDDEVDDEVDDDNEVDCEDEEKPCDTAMRLYRARAQEVRSKFRTDCLNYKCKTSAGADLFYDEITKNTAIVLLMFRECAAASLEFSAEFRRKVQSVSEKFPPDAAISQPHIVYFEMDRDDCDANVETAFVIADKISQELRKVSIEPTFYHVMCGETVVSAHREHTNSYRKYIKEKMCEVDSDDEIEDEIEDASDETEDASDEETEDEVEDEDDTEKSVAPRRSSRLRDTVVIDSDEDADEIEDEDDYVDY